jgi:hypothetical protein
MVAIGNHRNYEHIGASVVSASLSMMKIVTASWSWSVRRVFVAFVKKGMDHPREHDAAAAAGPYSSSCCEGDARL